MSTTSGGQTMLESVLSEGSDGQYIEVDLVDPVTEFLDARFDVGTDPFVRELPAQLVIQACRHAYVYWVEHGDFASLRSALRIAMTMIVGPLTPR